ncbi:molybdate ABC transporter permease subunit [Saccharicrinis aurantiacus]|uniref:molybdate ABC transporter permease subunit n=1 Tax=Saccharicrinis aurantiacus TaxID=1849719 RepID=UPI002493B595|nr:molybdate ABC transporter permease subunit [Saccharicrinis aurantiacus]
MTSNDYLSIWLSLKVALYTSIIALPIAIIIGYFLARRNFKGKSIIEAILHLPMVMPPVTTGYLLLILLGSNSLLGTFLKNTFDIKIAFTFEAAVIASAIVSFPLIMRSVKVAMEMVDPNLEQASKTLGASPLQTFVYITLPLATPGILGGFVLAFARSLGEFGATITFAGNIAGETRTLPLAIYAKMQVPGQEHETFYLVGISVIISFAAIIGSEYFYQKKKNLTK